MSSLYFCFVFYGCGGHRDLHVLTHSFPTRRSSDLLHTDHFEKHVLPRPGTRWDMVSAVMAHDAQMAAGGITTSFDCVCVGVSIKHPGRREIFRPMIDAVREASTKGDRKSTRLNSSH